MHFADHFAPGWLTRAREFCVRIPKIWFWRVFHAPILACPVQLWRHFGLERVNQVCMFCVLISNTVSAMSPTLSAALWFAELWCAPAFPLGLWAAKPGWLSRRQLSKPSLVAVEIPLRWGSGQSPAAFLFRFLAK